MSVQTGGASQRMFRWTVLDPPSPFPIRPSTRHMGAPGRLFAPTQPDRRLLTWYSGEGGRVLDPDPSH